MPAADLVTVHGKVAQADGTPVWRIRIIHNTDSASVYSDEDGSYSFTASVYPGHSLLIHAIDEDGAWRGGDFQPAEVVVTHEKRGEDLDVTQDITLTPKP